MKISVVIPVYNAEKFLEMAVESALKQTEVTEVILIEDCSPDNALGICKKLKEKYKKIKLYQHPDRKNHGAATSRNLGIIKANNDWIAFLDADDVYLENRFKHIPEIVKKRKEVDGIYDAIGVFFENEKLQKEWNIGELTTVKDILIPEELFFYLLFGKGYFSLDGLTVKKELLIRVGLFDDRLRLHQDTHLCAKLAASGHLFPGIIKTPVAMRRVHDKNRISGLRSKFFYTRIDLYKYLLEWIKAQKKYIIGL